MFDIDIIIEDEHWHEQSWIEADLPDILHQALSEIPHFSGQSKPAGEISLLFTNDTAIRELNNDYRGKDKATNVLSFPQIEWEESPADKLPYYPLGDIVLAYETIAREAQEQKKPLRDHILHMTVHGLLHLCGYDHETEDEAEEMESLETAILQKFSVKNPYET